MKITSRTRLFTHFGVFIAGVIITLLSIPVYWLFSSLTVGRPIQTLRSPNDRHTAVLRRKHNLADFNFIVEINGRTVYISPDLCGAGDRSLRESLVWDKSGQVVVLELMGKRVFAYNATDGEVLGKGQLVGREFHPAPEDNFCTLLRDIDEE